MLAGRTVQAVGADLDHLRGTVNRAADLSTGLAVVLHRTVGTGPPGLRHQPDRHDRAAQMPGVAERLFTYAQAVDRDFTAIRSSPPAAREVPLSR